MSSDTKKSCPNRNASVYVPYFKDLVPSRIALPALLEFQAARKTWMGFTRHCTGTLELTILDPNYIFERFQNAISKFRFCVRGQKVTFANLFPRVRFGISWFQKVTYFRFVSLRFALTIITLNLTLTTVFGKKLCNQQIVTETDTAKNL